MTSTPADRERWPRVEAILDEALEMPAAERAAFLDRACADDPQLRAEVDELLAADEEAGDFMESPAGETLLGDEVPPEAGLEGRQLGPYRVERRLAAGGMGVVYEARDTRLHRPVALKVLPFAWGHEPEAKERFIREARAASALDHPNICTVYDVGEFDDGRIFMVMAYYRGETLKEKLQGGPLAIAEARDLAIQVARGLDRAHEAGITHRDVKPANIMVPERGEAKILDFGIAKIAGEAGITGPRTTPATPAYLSPERALGQEADVRSDVWSLGVVMYEMLAGRRPFPGDQAQAVIYSILHQEPEPLERLCPQVPAALARTVAKAMAKDPAQRYQRVADLLADLESGSAPAMTAGARRRRRFRLAAAAVLVGGLLALAGWWAFRESDGVEEINTFSNEARDLYLEGRELCRLSQWEDAQPLLEEAINLDPGFAQALADLGNLHSNLGHPDLAKYYYRRAIDNVEDLQTYGRYFVLGKFNSLSWTTYDKAIDAFRQGLEEFPDDDGLQGNLAGLYADLERFEDAIREYQAAIDRGTRDAGMHYALAMIHGARDDFETGYQLLSDFTRDNPKNWHGELSLGWHLIQWGKLDEAVEHVQRADVLLPDYHFVREGWWRLRILQEDWNQAALDAQQLVDSDDTYGRWRGWVCTARNHLYAGRSAEALQWFRESAVAYSDPGAYTALSHCLAAQLLLQTGQPAKALEEAKQAQEAHDQWPELRGMFLAALSQQELGQSAEADRLATMLRERTKRENRRAVERRLLLHLSGRLALERADAAVAIRDLTDAVERLPPRGGQTHYHLEPDHVPLWYALGEAELAAGHRERAAGWFRKVTESGAEHIEFPVLFVRSHFQLGKIYEALGEPTKAAEAYARFVGYWRNGDLDRDDIQHAIAESASASGR